MEPLTWSIVLVSNFDHEDWRGDQWFVAQKIPNKRLAKIMAEALNEDVGPNSEDYYKVVDGNYVLPPDWEP